MNQYYSIQYKKGEGAYSEVYVGYSKKVCKQVAIKYFKQKYKNIQKIRNDRQIKGLIQLNNHPNIIKLIDIIYQQTTGNYPIKIGSLALVFQIMQMNLYQFIKIQKQSLNPFQLKFISYQLLSTLNFIHSKNIFHRDIKPQNILINSSNQIKLADFGSCKNYKSKQPHTQYISTRWYRSPQSLITNGFYNQKIDIWAAGCVIFQLYTGFPLFPGNNQIDQLNQIHHLFGTPSKQVVQKIKKKDPSSIDFNQQKYQKGKGLDSVLPDADQLFIELLEQLLEYNPQNRISAQKALIHNYFDEEFLNGIKQGRLKKRKQSDHFLPVLQKHGINKTKVEQKKHI